MKRGKNEESERLRPWYITQAQGSWDLHRCTSAVMNRTAPLKRVLGKRKVEGEQIEHGRLLNYLKRSQRQRRKMPERNKGNREQMNCAQDVTKEKSKVMVAWGEMQGEHRAKWRELLEATTQTRQSSLAENRSPHTLQTSIFPVFPALRDHPQFPTALQKRGAENFYTKCLWDLQNSQQVSGRNSLLSLDCQHFWGDGSWW